MVTKEQLTTAVKAAAALMLLIVMAGGVTLYAGGGPALFTVVTLAVLALGYGVRHYRVSISRRPNSSE